MVAWTSTSTADPSVALPPERTPWVWKELGIVGNMEERHGVLHGDYIRPCYSPEKGPTFLAYWALRGLMRARRLQVSSEQWSPINPKTGGCLLNRAAMNPREIWPDLVC